MSADPSHLHERLLDWYDSHRRDLPWRQTQDPYAIWVSEVMLQQTQVATVLPYYKRWMERFPNATSLALADEQDVLSHWQGLGYYRRCRLLQQGAKYVLERGVPGTAAEWRAVPGVGAYTAGAISSIAQAQVEPLVDGNVERVFARLTECREAGPSLTRSAWKWAASAVHPQRPGDWNQALMELGATVCKPLNPECAACPLNEYCTARLAGTQNELPVRSAKQPVIKQHHLVWVPVAGGKLGVEQIPKGQWWEGMWQFPREILGKDGTPARLPELLKDPWLRNLGEIRHAVTNHRITITALLACLDEQSPELRWIRSEELKDLPMPAPQRRVLKLALPHLA